MVNRSIDASDRPQRVGKCKDMITFSSLSTDMKPIRLAMRKLLVLHANAKPIARVSGHEGTSQAKVKHKSRPRQRWCPRSKPRQMGAKEGWGRLVMPQMAMRRSEITRKGTY